MAATASPRTFRPVPCAHCRRAVSWPRWRKVAAQAYDPLCWPCFTASTLIVTMARRSAEPLTTPPYARAFARIAQLRAEGWALVYPEAGELARLRKGAEVVIVPIPYTVRGAR